MTEKKLKTDVLLTHAGDKVTQKEEVKLKIARWKARDLELVSGVFRNLENRGQPLKFEYKIYDDPTVQYTLECGMPYRIPRGVANHLRKRCFTYEYAALPANVLGIEVQAGHADGRSTKPQDLTVKKKVPRFAFDSVDFMGEDYGPENQIIQVSYGR